MTDRMLTPEDVADWDRDAQRLLGKPLAACTTAELRHLQVLLAEENTRRVSADDQARRKAITEAAGLTEFQWAAGERLVGKPRERWTEDDWDRYEAHARAEADRAAAIADHMDAVNAEADACGCDAFNVPYNPDGTRDFAHASVDHSCGREQP